jgi:cytochrome P450 PksS
MLRFEFTSQGYLRDPAAHLAKLRAAGPVLQVRFPIVGRTWITTTSELAGRVLKDSETFIMRKDGRPAGLGWSSQHLAEADAEKAMSRRGW